MYKPFTSFALERLRPKATWEMVDEDYDKLTWTDNKQSKPTKEEVEAEAEKILQEYATLEYQRKRVVEYPPIGDQLDDLYHAGLFSEEMMERIKEIKDKYPKE